jgi:hypothetical protein
MPRKMPPKRRAYDTDLSDGQWALIEPMIPLAEPGGRPRKAATRDLVDAILYLLRAGGSWRLLPHDLLPWQTVYYYLRRWQREGVWNVPIGEDHRQGLRRSSEATRHPVLSKAAGRRCGVRGGQADGRECRRARPAGRRC